MPPDYGRNVGQDLGIPGTNGPNIRQSGIPTFNISGLAAWGNIDTWSPTFRYGVRNIIETADQVKPGVHPWCNRSGAALIRRHGVCSSDRRSVREYRTRYSSWTGDHPTQRQPLPAAQHG
jgi:hypothetical protein